jgi:beta-lactamase class D
VTQRPDLAHYFTDTGTDGTMVAVDPRTRTAVAVNAERGGRSYLPASTFKIVNTINGLETGTAKDIGAEMFKRDGAPPDPILPRECDADMPLMTAFKYSCVPVYQRLARRIGREASDHWLTAVFVFHEAFTMVHAVAFAAIWTGLALYSRPEEPRVAPLPDKAALQPEL